MARQRTKVKGVKVAYIPTNVRPVLTKVNITKGEQALAILTAMCDGKANTKKVVAQNCYAIKS